jgi:hypothetical protein
MNRQHQTLDADTKKFRLGVFCPDYTQPISLMRILGPFAAMAKEDSRLELVLPERVWRDGQEVWQLGWTWLAKCDAIFYSHPQGDVDISTLWLAQQMGVPVWSEYVDDLFTVRDSNPAKRLRHDPEELRGRVTQAIQLSSLVTAVSEICRQQYPLPEKIAVIPEACLWPANNFPRRRCISWRGLGSHDEDAESIIEAVCRVAKDFPDWEWCLMGDPLPKLVRELQKANPGEDAKGEPMVKLAPFFSTPWHAITAWGYRAPYLHLTPLADNAFNRSKSHLAWLEATAIGAAVIAPKYLPEWQQPGVIGYDGGSITFDGKEDFETVLRREIAGFKPSPNLTVNELTGGFHPNVGTARAAIYPHRTERAINQLRWQVLRKLAALTRKGVAA